MESADRAIELAPDDSTVRAIRAFVLDWYAYTPLVGGERREELLVEAEREASRAFQLDPENALALAYYAEILADQQKWTQAEKYAAQAVALDPEFDGHPPCVRLRAGDPGQVQQRHPAVPGSGAHQSQHDLPVHPHRPELPGGHLQSTPEARPGAGLLRPRRQDQRAAGHPEPAALSSRSPAPTPRSASSSPPRSTPKKPWNTTRPMPTLTGSWGSSSAGRATTKALCRC